MGKHSKPRSADLESSAARCLKQTTDPKLNAMVVSPALLAHDVSARAGDVSMGIAVFPTG